MSRPNKGFTLVELLVVAPIVILVIGGFIGAIIAMTGNVLATRSDNQLAYNIQDALDRIESDVRISGGFLPTNNVTISNNQGKDDTNNKFSYDNPALILNSYATTSNPSTAARNIVYRSSPTNPCASATVSQNNPLMFNTVYFIKNNTLWRRTVAPGDFFSGTFCNATTHLATSAWQKPSCTTITGPFCISKDVRLVDGVTALTIQYYLSNGTLSTTPPSVANSGIAVTITATGSAAGRKFTGSGTVRATSPNNNFIAN